MSNFSLRASASLLTFTFGVMTAFAFHYGANAAVDYFLPDPTPSEVLLPLEPVPISMPPKTAEDWPCGALK